MNGYENLIWVNDKEGNEYVCSLDTHRAPVANLDDLSEHERQSCCNVNEIIGTERW